MPTKLSNHKHDIKPCLGRRSLAVGTSRLVVDQNNNTFWELWGTPPRWGQNYCRGCGGCGRSPVKSTSPAEKASLPSTRIHRSPNVKGASDRQLERASSSIMAHKNQTTSTYEFADYASVANDDRAKPIHASSVPNMAAVCR